MTFPIEPWWYLSFAGEEGFLGGVVVGPAGGIAEAVQLARRRNCNPGGEVLGCPIPPTLVPPERFRFRLMDKEQVQEMETAVQRECMS